MPPNLRSVIERVTRGGRSVVSSRNFSSCANCGNDSKEAGERVVAAAGLKRVVNGILGTGFGLNNTLLPPNQKHRLEKDKAKKYEEKLRLKIKKVRNELRQLSLKNDVLTSRSEHLTWRVDALASKAGSKSP